MHALKEDAHFSNVGRTKEDAYPTRIEAKQKNEQDK